MERRALLATFLVILIFLAWQHFFLKRETLTPQEQETPLAPPVEAPAIQSSRLLGAVSTKMFNLPEKDVVVETPFLRVILSTKGGGVKSWQLKRYTLEGGTPVELVAFHQDGPFPLTSAVQEEPALLSYRVAKEKLFLLSPFDKGSITFTHMDRSGLLIEKSFNFRGNGYEAEARLRFKNLGKTDLSIVPTLAWGPGFRESRDQKVSHPVTPTIWLNGRKVEQSLKKLQGTATHRGNISWAALHDTYFAAALIPLGHKAQAFVAKDTRDQPTIGFTNEPKRLPPGGETEVAFLIYAGPKELDRLKEVGHNLNDLVDFGWFDFLARPALYFLKFIHRYTGNYGIAIITLSILIKLLSFPLSYKSLKSMQAMQALQPKLAALKERYKNNPKKLNQEMMELYKRHGVNPLSGCLPMLLQFPIFIAIYNVLVYSVELWRAPFVLWIKDLSKPDTLGRMSLWGKSLDINILPFLMGISMFIQQKMTPQAGDPKQAQLMLYMMPLFLTFVFWSLPSGLNLYWAIFNILSIGQQYLFNRGMPWTFVKGRKAG